MDRKEFEYLRDLPNKTIDSDIVLQKSKESAPIFATTVYINNSINVETKLRIEWNEQTDSKTLNVWVPGTGPICRLEVDSRPHRPYGRNHKHSLEQPDCSHSSENLRRNIVNKEDMAGKTIQAVFTEFCQMANIIHKGSFVIAKQ